MLASEHLGKCPECSGQVLDLGDEFACKLCGVVLPKEVVYPREERTPQALDFTKHALGGYLGPQEYGYEEKFSRGFASASSKFRYLKLVSDYTGKEQSSLYACAKMVERVCEKLGVPKIVVSQSMVIAKKVFGVRKARNEMTVAAISAFSIITACKIEGVTSMGVKEVVTAHRMLGRRVKMSALIQISLESPVRPEARKAENYLSRVISRLSSTPSIQSRVRQHFAKETIYFNRLYETARLLLRNVEEDAQAGHNPCALAATAVYAAEMVLAKDESRKKILTQRDAALALGVAEYTVREQYGEIFRPVQLEADGVLRQRLNPPHVPAS